jgi:hypothetical protein
MKREDALAMWKERIADIDKEIEANKEETKKIATAATVEIREQRKALMSRKGKMLRALKAVEDDLDDYPPTTDIEA